MPYVCVSMQIRGEQDKYVAYLQLGQVNIKGITSQPAFNLHGVYSKTHVNGWGDLSLVFWLVVWQAGKGQTGLYY